MYAEQIRSLCASFKRFLSLFCFLPDKVMPVLTIITDKASKP